MKNIHSIMYPHPKLYYEILRFSGVIVRKP